MGYVALIFPLSVSLSIPIIHQYFLNVDLKRIGEGSYHSIVSNISFIYESSIIAVVLRICLNNAAVH